MSIESLEAGMIGIENNLDLLRLHGIAVFRQDLPILCSLSSEDLVTCLLDWRVDCPNALYRLLEAVAQSDEASDHVAEALTHILSGWTEEPGTTDDVLVRAFPRIPSPQRNWVADRPGVHGPLGPVAGRDFESMGDLADEDEWPEGTPQPPGDTVAGLQARLQWNLNPGPVTGTWNPKTRAALYRFQFEHGILSPGTIDEETLRDLGVEPDEIERVRERGYQLVEGSPCTGVLTSENLVTSSTVPAPK
jgi:putative peptidoglycan binding protein